MTEQNRPQHRNTIIDVIEEFLSAYVEFPEVGQSFVCALWCLATHLFENFDAFPYVVINASTKQAGKTVLMETMSFCCANSFRTAGATGPSLFARLEVTMQCPKCAVKKQDETWKHCLGCKVDTFQRPMPTMFLDEAERQSNDDAGIMRELINSGYRRGSYIPRFRKEYPSFCPKAFVLIGSVNDTLNDRSIVITLRRGRGTLRYSFTQAERGGADIVAKHINKILARVKADVEKAYRMHKGIQFLVSGREEEIWLPLFALADVVCPDRIDELSRIAQDLATAKTAPLARYTELRAAEGEALTLQYQEPLLMDLYTVLQQRKALFSAECVEALKELPTAPWRRFRGTGLTERDMAAMLKQFQVFPSGFRKGGRGTPLRRGYRLAQVQAAVDALKGGAE